MASPKSPGTRRMRALFKPIPHEPSHARQRIHRLPAKIPLPAHRAARIVDHLHRLYSGEPRLQGGGRQRAAPLAVLGSGFQRRQGGRHGRRVVSDHDVHHAVHRVAHRCHGHPPDVPARLRDLPDLTADHDRQREPLDRPARRALSAGARPGPDGAGDDRGRQTLLQRRPALGRVLALLCPDEPRFRLRRLDSRPGSLPTARRSRRTRFMADAMAGHGTEHLPGADPAERGLHRARPVSRLVVPARGRGNDRGWGGRHPTPRSHQGQKLVRDHGGKHPRHGGSRPGGYSPVCGFSRRSTGFCSSCCWWSA